MPKTRRGASTGPVMNEKSVKNIVVDAVKEAISNLPNKDQMKDLLDALETKLNETVWEKIKKAVEPLNAKVEQLELKHAVYEAHFAGLEKRLEDAEEYLDDTEQYSRRACLRIHGIPLPKKAEFATDCIRKVKEVFKEIEVTAPDEAIDRAHCIGGKVKDNATGEVRQAMIVKFLTWKYRTAV